MKKTTTFIVKRTYDTSRTGTEAFVKLMKKSKKNNIDYTQYKIDNEKGLCYTENSFRESCVISRNFKED